MKNLIRFFEKYKIHEYLVVIGLVILIFYPLFHAELFEYGFHGDFNAHWKMAVQLFESPRIPPGYDITHLGWQWAVILSHAILGHSWQMNAVLVTLSTVLLAVGIMFWMLRKQLSFLLAGLLSLGLVFFVPLAFLYPVDHQLYLGYVGINSLHNPTILFLKPFALLQLYFAVQVFQKKNSNWITIVIAFLVSVAAILGKPSYIICLLPAMGIIALIHILKKKIIDWKLLLIGIVLPSAALLIWQFIVFSGPTQESGIIWAPFKVMLAYVSQLFVSKAPIDVQNFYRILFLIAKLLLSIVFPVIVTGVYWKEIFKDIRMQLGWIGFGLGTIFTYLLAEKVNYTAGNLTWSSEITLFLLFACCILFLADKKLQTSSRLSKWLIIISGSMHIIFGIIYFLVFLKTGIYD